jgi:6-phosphofructokinase
MKPKNLLFVQSGGVTSVINTTAAGVIETARASNAIGKVFAGKNGISGILKEELIDTSHESDTQIKNLKYTPGGAFGSCRYKLKDPKTNPNEYLRLLEIFKAYNIGYFLYNGGGDSQDTTNKIANFTQKSGFTVQCIGIPKTVDNDLPHTDNCPGFGSVAKYTAISTREAALDVKSMSDTSTKVFIMEVMGRHAGWIAASSSLASEDNDGPPHIILFPEKKLLQNKFLKKVKHTVLKEGYCVIVVSEGLRDFKGKFLSDSGKIDAFGHKQLGGVAPRIAEIVQTKLGYKCHWSVPRHITKDSS